MNIQKSIWICLGLLLVAGCAPYSAMQSPVPQADGTTGGMVGFSMPQWYFTEDESILYTLTASIRRGIAPRTDTGIRFGAAEGFTWDIKYEFIQSFVSVSGDVGISLSSFGVSVQPMMLAGTDHVYAGLRYVINAHG